MARQDRARQPLTPSQKQYLRQGRIILLIAAAIFIAGVFAIKPLLDRPLRIDDLLALIGGFLMLQLMAIMIVTYTIGPRNPDRRQPLTNVLTAATLAATLLLPVVGQDLIDPKLNFAIVLVLLAAGAWLHWRMWRASDELDRAFQRETNSANYIILITVLSVYAVGERLGFLGGVTAWGALVFATFAAMPVGIWIATRRGLAQLTEDELRDDAGATANGAGQKDF